jgi:hypothetical protein
MCQALHDEFGMQMHTALATLRTSPTREAYDALGWLINCVFITIANDPKFEDALAPIDAAIKMMNKLGQRCEGSSLSDYEIACLTSCVSLMDDILPRLDVTKIHLANLSLKAAI